MTPFTLRCRILGVLGPSLLFSGALGACGGETTASGGGTAGAGGSGGTGGSTVQAGGGTSSTGGASGAGGRGAGGRGTAGGGGSAGEDGGPAMACLTHDAILSMCTQGVSFCTNDDGGVWDVDAGLVCPDRIMVFCDGYAGPPVVQDSGCCYRYIPSAPACGRPFLVDGEPRRAPAEVRSDWLARVGTDDPALDPGTRRSLAFAWLEDARFEHASIASFARFTLELLALGAPADLVADAQRAAADEVGHARDCFSLASRYAGEPLGPGPLAIDGTVLAPTLIEAAVSAVREGCVGETLAALQAGAQLEHATDTAVRSALSRIADDEARHAELAWRFVRWAIAEGGPAVRAAVARAFRDSLEELEAAEPRPSADIDASAWHAHGRLLPSEELASRLHSAREVIGPCSSALLGSPSGGLDSATKSSPGAIACNDRIH